jgi:hypothetical protein
VRGFVRAQDAAAFQGGETFTQRVELHGGLGLVASAQPAGPLQESDPAVQATERILLGASECAGEAGRHAGPQKTDREQRRVADREAAKDGHARLDKICGGIAGCR